MNNLEGGVGFAGTGGHYQQQAVLPAGYGLHRLVHGQRLIIARLVGHAVLVERLGEKLLLLGLLQIFVAAIALP
ncbi:hypothetical protein N008_09770 [Hymenobacter sp. APR13]|nr:hypothetical protein N008_09770 [Hymenobacter sp. APR13]